MGQTALHFAMKYGNHELARLLVEKGANMNAMDIVFSLIKKSNSLKESQMM